MLKNNLPAALAAIDAQLKAKNAAGALLVEGAAKGRAPVDTGRLRSSITHDSDASGFIVGTNVEYGVFQELGTRHMPPKPFLVPGLRNSIGALRGIYGGR